MGHKRQVDCYLDQSSFSYWASYWAGLLWYVPCFWYCKPVFLCHSSPSLICMKQEFQYRTYSNTLNKYIRRNYSKLGLHLSNVAKKVLFFRHFWPFLSFDLFWPLWPYWSFLTKQVKQWSSTMGRKNDFSRFAYAWIMAKYSNSIEFIRYVPDFPLIGYWQHYFWPPFVYYKSKHWELQCNCLHFGSSVDP